MKKAIFPKAVFHTYAKMLPNKKTFLTVAVVSFEPSKNQLPKNRPKQISFH